MSYIKVVKVKENIENLNQYMNIYQAINRLDWILKNKCINCEQQCTDCYLDFESKIAIEKILNPAKLRIIPPDKIPSAKDTTTFLVTKAKTIATIGGIKVRNPYLSAFTCAISTSSANAMTVDIKNIIIDIKTIFVFLFLIFSS